MREKRFVVSARMKRNSSKASIISSPGGCWREGVGGHMEEWRWCARTRKRAGISHEERLLKKCHRKLKCVLRPSNLAKQWRGLSSFAALRTHFAAYWGHKYDKRHSRNINTWALHTRDKGGEKLISLSTQVYYYYYYYYCYIVVEWVSLCAACSGASWENKIHYENPLPPYHREKSSLLSRERASFTGRRTLDFVVPCVTQVYLMKVTRLVYYIHSCSNLIIFYIRNIIRQVINILYLYFELVIGSKVSSRANDSLKSAILSQNVSLY